MHIELGHSQGRSFRHGAHPAEMKEATNRIPIQRMPFVDELVLPLSQHIGAPSIAIVEPGDFVKRGQLIARPGGFVSVGLHAPATGTIEAIELRRHPSGNLVPSIVLRTDTFDSQRLHVDKPPALDELETKDILKHIQEAGIVGLGGAAFPSHVKLSIPEGKRVRYVMLNGCECEPYLTCDHRVMVEQPREVLQGLRILMKIVNAEQGYIGIETNKLDAIEILREGITDEDKIEVVDLKVKYPQGAEKMLIDAIRKVEVPAGGFPIAKEMLVNNVGTAASLTEYFETGKPLIERVVTVTGSGVRRPANLMVPLGTPISALIDHCGGLVPETKQVVIGGPMMGMAQAALDAPVMKGVSGVLALTEEPVRAVDEEPCVRCGKCLQACPMFLNPTRLAHLVLAEMPEKLGQHNIMSCFECASCSFVCPSRIPIVQLIRVGKAMFSQLEVS